MNKVKDIILKLISFCAAKLGYVLLPIKEIEVKAPETVTEEKSVTALISEEQKERIFELFKMIQEQNFIIKLDLGEPKEPLPELMRKVETGDYEKGILKKIAEIHHDKTKMKRTYEDKNRG